MSQYHLVCGRSSQRNKHRRPTYNADSTRIATNVTAFHQREALDARRWRANNSTSALCDTKQVKNKVSADKWTMECTVSAFPGISKLERMQESDRAFPSIRTRRKSACAGTAADTTRNAIPIHSRPVMKVFTRHFEVNVNWRLYNNGATSKLVKTTTESQIYHPGDVFVATLVDGNHRKWSKPLCRERSKRRNGSQHATTPTGRSIIANAKMGHILRGIYLRLTELY
eukprot:GEMP01053083.1.p2 GENE.GEMP01053083.1~~GEMP01053083.1.p2  ORF type:complete len:227 (-),score=19.45 GEMP01053083.1:145-825(-)